MGVFDLTVLKLMRLAKGGKGSGFFGHDGRPGEKGGSAPAGAEHKAFSETLRTKEGATVSLMGKVPKDGYTVSPYKQFETRVSVRMQKANLMGEFAKFRRKHDELLREPGHHLGSWVDKGEIVLDVSVNVANESEAIRIGKMAHQDSYYDVKNGKEVKIR